MQWYGYAALLMIAAQVVAVGFIFSNFHYALSKYKRKREGYRPRVVLIVPCKGIDTRFDENILSFFQQDYEGYHLWFVVESERDLAYDRLKKIIAEKREMSRAGEVRLLVAGISQGSSQKVHNLLYCYRKLSDDVEVMAFADSDICVQEYWLSHLVYPLRRARCGASSGYRWYVPSRNNLASLALSCLNAKVAQLLGNSPFNQVWGGSMAIKVEIFLQAGLEEIWKNALSDDLSLSWAVKKLGRKVAYVPACLAASYEETDWRGLLEFGRRQFLITRVSASGTWWFGLATNLYHFIGFWGSGVLAIILFGLGNDLWKLSGLVCVVFLGGQLTRSILRELMVYKLLSEARSQMRMSMAADVVLGQLWTVLMVYIIIKSGFGREITWRGIRYRLVSPTETMIIGADGRQV